MVGNSKNGPLYLCLVALIFSIAIRDVLFVPISDMLLTLLIAFCMFLLPYKQLVPFVFFLLPLTCGIPGYVMLLAYITLVYKGRGINSAQLLPVVIILLLELLSEGMTGDVNTWYKILSLISFVAIFFYFLNVRPDKTIDLSRCVLFFCFGVAFTILVIYYNMFRLYGLSDILSGLYRSGALGIEGNDSSMMEGHLALNANSLAYYAVCTVTSLLIGLKYFQINKQVVFSLIFFIFIGGLLTFSRTYIFCISFFALLYYLINKPSVKIGAILIVTILSLMAYFFFDSFSETIYETYTDRIEDANAVTAGGRTVIFRQYNIKWADNFLYVIFGCGSIDYVKTLQMYKAIHCGLQQIWVCLGICGLFLFVQQIGAYVVKYMKNKSILLLLPFLVSLLFNQTVQFLNPYSLILPILAPLFVCRIGFSLKK